MPRLGPMLAVPEALKRGPRIRNTRGENLESPAYFA